MSVRAVTIVCHMHEIICHSHFCNKSKKLILRNFSRLSITIPETCEKIIVISSLICLISIFFPFQPFTSKGKNANANQEKPPNITNFM